ncbi:hypothetical protein [Deinococcus peraridilitoris]|uniref:Uncharacterized protein n=1 Tax=Deinococcus peraridilitoris (strain DSM 19664 / LMG 22246 / CIP 109416 / KR-200) TaxID=937777 RepID=L0A0Q9_DEIPD|nr:hypothetical protein [Deinococcus peraridilitoris]AFZ67431.1 hypothetical protein Deipe_1928 [Deinococcus peraridilitoris DSM 19664]
MSIPGVGLISHYAHARIDFAASGVMLLAPLLLPLRRRTTVISILLAASGFLVGSHTAYPFPLRGTPLISWQDHRRIENASFPAYLFLSAGCGALCFRPDRTYLLLLLASYMLVHTLTDWSEPDAERGQ